MGANEESIEYKDDPIRWLKQCEQNEDAASKRDHNLRTGGEKSNDRFLCAEKRCCEKTSGSAAADNEGFPHAVRGIPLVRSHIFCCERLSRNGEAVDYIGAKHKQLKRDLVGGKRVWPHSGHSSGCKDQREAQRSGARCEIATDVKQWLQQWPLYAPLAWPVGDCGARKEKYDQGACCSNKLGSP